MLKVGDRVRSISDDGTGGKEGILIQDDHSEVPYLVRFDDWRGGHGDGDNEWWLNHDELVPVAEATGTDAGALGDEPKFKVGDRVKFRDDYNSSARGTEATVVGVNSWGIMVDGVHGKSTEQPSSLQHVPTTLTIQAGRYYRTRDGRKVGPMLVWNKDSEWPWSDHADSGSGIWRGDGSVFDHREDDDDIIAEWVGEPSDVFDELERWMADNPQPANDNSTAGFTIPLCELEAEPDLTAIGKAYADGYAAGLAARQAA